MLAMYFSYQANLKQENGSARVKKESKQATS